MENSFGASLKDWRNRRRMSQLNLSGVANVSARHIAFLETGRARPSRSMVLQLSDALAVPRAERNTLLQAAGFSSAYRARPLDASDMAGIRSAVEWMLVRHQPYPALALDRHWRLILLNRTASTLVASVGLKQGDSLIGAFTHDGRLWAALDNAAEIAQHLVARLRTESAHVGGDVVLDAAAQKIAARVQSEAWDGTGPLPPVVPTRLRAGATVLSFFSTIAQFGTAEDIALSDLRIELFFPSDAVTQAAFEVMGQ